MATSSSPTIKELEKRMDTLCQTVQRCEGMFLLNGVWCSRCVTCGAISPCFGKNCIQGGHYVPRGCRITRWEAANVHPQCTRCNGFLNGNYLFYSQWMRKHHDEEAQQLMDLFAKHRKGVAPKLTVLEKRALYNSWLKKGRELEELTGMKLFPKKWDYAKI